MDAGFKGWLNRFLNFPLGTLSDSPHGGRCVMF